MPKVLADPVGATLATETEETLRAVLRGVPSPSTSVTKESSIGPKKQSDAARVEPRTDFAVRPGTCRAMSPTWATSEEEVLMERKLRSCSSAIAVSTSSVGVLRGEGAI